MSSFNGDLMQLETTHYAPEMIPNNSAKPSHSYEMCQLFTILGDQTERYDVSFSIQSFITPTCFRSLRLMQPKLPYWAFRA